MNLTKASTKVLKSQPWKSSSLKNGLKLYSHDDLSPISHLSIIFKSGPRFESHNLQGMSHLLNIQLSNSKEKCSPLNLVRSINQQGATLLCGLNREFIYFSLTCCKYLLDEVSPFLVLSALHPVFKPWEVEDSQKLLSADIDKIMSDPYNVLLDKLHEAAFRRGLGNSLYARNTNIGHEALNHFYEGIAVTERTTVVGVGVSEEEVERFGRLLDVRPGKVAESVPSTFHGAEVRVPSGSSVGYVAVVVPGGCLGVREDYLCSNILKTLLGDDYGVNRGGHVLTSRLEKAFVARQSPHVSRGISLSYSDAGMVGYYVVAGSEDVGQLVMSAQKEFQHILEGHVSREEFERAKVQYKGLLARRESQDKFVRALPYANLGLGVQDLGNVWRDVDALQFETFQNFLSTRGNKFAMSAVGGISTVPYLDELTN